MNVRRIFATCLSLLLLLAAFSLQAQMTLPSEIEVGYRSLDLTGNEGMYRTQINERDGFLLRSVVWSTPGFAGGDHFRLDVSDLGAGPASALRLETGRSGAYNLRIGYRRTEAFSALPAFANPLLGQGVIPGQHTYDRNRDMLDVDLEFLPTSHFTPFVGYAYNRYSGPGTTTYHFGGDEFLMNQDLTDTDHEFRVGSGFTFGKVYGQLTQGWRTYKNNETVTLFAGAGGGNNSGPVLGHPINADSITRNSKYDGDTPFTSFYITGQPMGRLRLIGNFTRFASTSDADETENATGSFASFEIGRFFTGITGNDTGQSKNTTWRGGVRAEVEIVPNIDFLAGWQREDRSLEGTALLNELYLNSITFGGADPRDFADVIDAKNSMDRTEDILNAAVSARALGPFSVRVGFSQTTNDVTLTPDLAEIVVPGPAQGGSFDRRISTYELVAGYAMAGFSVNGSVKKDDANDPILRSDFLNRDRYRLRAGYQTPNNKFRAFVTGEETMQDNDRPEFQYDAKFRNYTGDIEFAPFEALTLRASASRLKTDTTMLYRRPETFDLDTSVHAENGKAYEGGFSLFVKRVSLDAAASRLDNTGTLPFKVDRFRTRLTFNIVAHTGIAAEWAKDKYHESLLPAADYDANRYGVYFLWHP